MKCIDDIPLPKIYIDVFKSEGIDELYPAQTKSIEPIFSGKNLVVAVPTAAGKTLIAYIAILRAKTLGMRALYIVPLRALAREKYEELQRFPNLRVALGIGDYDIPPKDLEECDVLVATSEKMDSILRHKPSFASDVGVVVADEIHLIDSYDRGPTLEATLTKMSIMNPNAQIIALSATISNSAEIAKWLNAVHIYDEWRPVPLKCGVYFGNTILFDDGTSWKIERDDDIEIGNLVLKAVREGGQCLIFVSRRKDSEILAEKIANKVYKVLDTESIETLRKIEIPEDGEGRDYWERISKLVRMGCSFHHAGLSNRQRSFIEDLFKSRIIKCIVATPTLAAGINLPARYVIIKDVYRFEGGFNTRIPAIEIKQMLGRAGRPKYDEVGYGIIIASSRNKAEEYLEYYVMGAPEPVQSKMGDEKSLRFHTLALVASEFANTLEGIYNFYEKTFYGFSNEISKVSIREAVEFLADNGFITKKGNVFVPTDFGKIVSNLYIDPSTALILREGLNYELTPFTILLLISQTPDMLQFYVNRDELEFLRKYFYKFSHEISNIKLREVSAEALKTALVLYDWIEEISIELISQKYNVGPGDVHSRVELAEWLIYSLKKIAKLFNYRDIEKIEIVRKRVIHGVKEDILELVALDGVGRVRGRRLKEHGFDIEAIRRASKEDLLKVPGIGEKLAERIINQVRREE